MIDMIGVGLILPVLPSLVGEFTASVEKQAYWYGALTFTFGVTQFLCAPLLGALSDRYGRRVVLLLSIGGLGTMFFLSGVVRSLPALLATRVVGGALASNVSVANAYVADVTTPENRARSFGMIGAAFGLGFILGPMIGGLVGGVHIRYPFFVAAGLALLVLAWRLRRGERWVWRLALTLIVAHEVVHRVLNLATLGTIPAEDVPFIVLTAAIVVLLLVPPTRRFFGPRAPAAVAAERAA